MPLQSDKNQSILAHPPRQSFTQGLLFGGGVAHGYEGCDTFGISITARCDASNDKVYTYNYLPVVALDDWLHRDGKQILARKLRSDSLGALENLLKKYGYSTSIIETESPEVIVTQLFPLDSTDKKISAARKDAEPILAKFVLAQRAEQSAPQDHVCAEIRTNYPKLVSGMLDDIVHHKLSGYYFLDCVDVYGDDHGYVVLIREIQTMPRELAQLILDGIDAQGFTSACEKCPEYKGRLQFGGINYAMPLAILKSPNIEHLLQTFAMLFSRIGIADTDPSYIASLWDRQPSFVERKLLSDSLPLKRLLLVTSFPTAYSKLRSLRVDRL